MRRKNNNTSGESGVKIVEKRNDKVWIVLFVMTALLLITFLVGYILKSNETSTYGTSLEKVYQKSYYDMVDSINTTESNLGKLINTTGGSYQKKLIKNAKDSSKYAQTTASYLPLATNSVSSTVKFLNQVYGYLSTLEQEINNGGSISETEMETLKSLYNSVSKMKNNLQEITAKLQSGKTIINESALDKEGMNDFSTTMKQIKSEDVDYPTMIYDGPFSDSVINKTIKGLSYDKVSQETALKNLSSLFDLKGEDVDFNGASEGKISTYNFTFKSDGNGYVQLSQNGGKLISLSGENLSNAVNYSLEEAEKTAAKFAIDAGIEEVEVVWSDIVGGDAYVNLAPTSGDVVLYPDLVKVKVDLATNKIIGYEASSYYTNHTQRQIESVEVQPESVKNKISKDFNVISKKIALAPLDYNREVLCHEFECKKGADTYYFYYNAKNGDLENILKVVKTNDGSLLI